MRVFNFFLICLFSLPLSAKEWMLDLHISSGYNNNVFLQDDLNQSIDDNGTNITEDIQSEFLIDTSYKILSFQNSDVKFMLAYELEYLKDNDISSALIDFAIPFSYYLKQTRFRLTPSVARYSSQGEKILSYKGIGFDITRKINWFRLGGFYNYQISDALNENYDAYEGISHDFHLQLEKLSYSQRIAYKIGYFKQDYIETLDGDESHMGYYASASFTAKLKRWEINLNAKIKQRNYVIDPLDNVNRRDMLVTSSIMPSYRISPSTKLFYTIRFSKNISNQNSETDNMNYTQWLNEIGISLSF